MSGDTENNTAGPTLEVPVRRSIFGLQFRFTVLVLCLTLSVVALVGVVLVDLTGQLLSRQKHEQCQQLGLLLARCSGEALARRDSAALESLAREFSADDPILFVTFIDPAGAAVACADASGSVGPGAVPSRQPPGDIMLGHPLFVPRQDRVDAHLEVTYPVDHPHPVGDGDRSPVGYVCVGLDVQRTMGEVASAVDLFSGTGIAVLVVTVPLVYLVIRCIVVPLNELSRTVRRFAQGELSARSTVRRSDEVGTLAATFNAMADELERNHRQITSLNTDLERRVARRTTQLRELAAREPLTGLYNRRHFNEVLTRRFSEAVRYQDDLSCLMIDLDDFKTVNDRFGHHVGDESLVLLATVISSQLRAADLAARFGGDEFIVLLPQTSADRAEVLAARIAEKFALDLADRLPRVRVSLSIGIASVAEASPADPEDLIRAADRALYRAKTEGKSRIALAVPA